MSGSGTVLPIRDVSFHGEFRRRRASVSARFRHPYRLELPTRTNVGDWCAESGCTVGQIGGTSAAPELPWTGDPWPPWIRPMREGEVTAGYENCLTAKRQARDETSQEFFRNVGNDSEPSALG
jgi:hypothetical protein